MAASFATEGSVLVRDTKVDGPALRFTTAEWATFVSALKQGDYRAS